MRGGASKAMQHHVQSIPGGQAGQQAEVAWAMHLTRLAPLRCMSAGAGAGVNFAALIFFLGGLAS